MRTSDRVGWAGHVVCAYAGRACALWPAGQRSPTEAMPIAVQKMKPSGQALGRRRALEKAHGGLYRNDGYFHTVERADSSSKLRVFVGVSSDVTAPNPSPYPITVGM